MQHVGTAAHAKSPRAEFGVWDPGDPADQFYFLVAVIEKRKKQKQKIIGKKFRVGIKKN